MKINGNEVITINVGAGAGEIYQNSSTDPYQSTTQVFASANGSSRTVPTSIYTLGQGTRTSRQLNIYTVEQGAPTPDGTNNATPVKNVLLFQVRDGAGSLSSNRLFGVAGDPSDASTRPSNATYTYTGEAIGYVYGINNGFVSEFIGPVTITVNYSSSAVTGEITVTQFRPDNSVAPTVPAFTVNLSASAAASGQLQGTLTLTGLEQSSSGTGLFTGQEYGSGVPQLGGSFSSEVNGVRVSGSFVASR